MSTWRLAGSLVALRAEIDALAPNRSRRSDGTIGDAAHRSRPSRHNPNPEGVVCALDITDDPGGGCPVHLLAEQVRANPHPNLAYVISDGRIAGRSTAWRWHTYTGANPHTRHAHFAVGQGKDARPFAPYDDTVPWGLRPPTDDDLLKAQRPTLPPRRLRRGMSGEDVRGLQRILIGAGFLRHGEDDGVFGARTEAAVRLLQSQLGVAVDGDVGPATHAAIARLLAALAV